MAKYKVNTTFYGNKEKKRFKASKTKAHEFTVKRAEEINKTLSDKYGIENALTRLDGPKEGAQDDQSESND